MLHGVVWLTVKKASRQTVERLTNAHRDDEGGTQGAVKEQ